MINFEEFADPKKHPFNTLETRMARAYRETVEDLESASRELWKTMRVEQVESEMLPYFLPEYEEPALVIEAAKNRLAEIQTDIENFMDIARSNSRRDVLLKLHRCELDIANAKRKAGNVLKKARQENRDQSQDSVEKLDTVQAAFLGRDVKLAELQPAISELERKLRDAEEILKKYA